MNISLEQLRSGIIVSCQSSDGDPTDFVEMIVAFALSAERGGAVGLRLNSPEHIAAVHARTNLPIIGIHKRPGANDLVLITGEKADIPPLVAAGAEIIAFDASERERPEPREALVETIHANGALAMADLRTFADAQQAVPLGVDLLGTTLSVWDLPAYQPNIALIRQLTATFDLPVIAEGNYWNPADVAAAFEAGAHAVVIGSAITRPWQITERYVQQS